MQQGIKQIRQSLNLQQQEVAKKIGVTIPYLYMLEKGQRNPSDKLKQKLCELYGIDMNALFLALNITKSENK